MTSGKDANRKSEMKSPSTDLSENNGKKTPLQEAGDAQTDFQSKLLIALGLANIGHWEHDIVNDIFLFNDSFLKIYRTTVEKIGGYALSPAEFAHHFVHPDDVPMVRKDMHNVMESIDSLSEHQLEHRFLYPDGTTGYMAVRIVFVKDESGRTVKAYGINQEITERKLAEQERLANLKFFESMEKVNQAILSGVNDLDRILRNVLSVCLSVFDCDRAFLLYPCDPDAPSWRVPMERTRPEYPGANILGKPIPMDPDVKRVLRIALAASGPVSFSPGSAHPPSRDFWEKHGFRSQMTMALHPKVGKPWLFGLHQCSHERDWTTEEEGVFEKIAQRLSDSLTSLLMYRDLRKSEAFLDNIVENIPDSIFVKDADKLRFVKINKACEKLVGFSSEEVIGKNSYDLFPEDEARFYYEKERGVVDGKRLVEIPEEAIKNSRGEQRILHTKMIPLLDENGEPQHLLGISEDITELKKLQVQLQQTQKLEALGAISGGIAHDFNNILQPLLGFCELLQEDLPPDSPQQQFVEGIFNAGVRARDLVRQILAFSSQSDRKVTSVEIQEILQEVVKLSRSIIPSSIDIRENIQADCAPVMADPTQLHQVTMNLIINAYHALSQSGGNISITLKETELGEDDLRAASFRPGRCAMMSVSDTGCGIDPKILDKIFDPYFTTKTQGKGTGLGLAVVYGIVKEHNGHIDVVSEVGKGSTFNVYLPLAEKAFQKMPAKKMGEYETGTERILLVDDEPEIIALERLLLERFGYHVTACSNGAEALSTFTENPDAFDLVISDLTMPNMTGDQLAEKLIEIRPGIPMAHPTARRVASSSKISNTVPA